MSEEITTNQPEAVPSQVEDTFDYGGEKEGVEVVASDSSDSNTDKALDVLGEVTEEEESEELDLDGYKVSLPKSKAEKLKAERMMHADYTKKTQEVAEHRKTVDRAVEAERVALANQAKAQQESIQEYATLVAIDQRIQQFNEVNWNQLNEQDPVTAQRLWIELSQLKDAHTTVRGKLQQKEQETQREEQRKTSETQQESAKQIRECFEVVKRDIKDWSPELASKLDKTAQDLGFSNEELSQVKDARFVKLLHKAHIADQLLKKQSVATPKPQPKPVNQVGAGSAPSSQRVENMSMADYIKARRAQLR